MRFPPVPHNGAGRERFRPLNALRKALHEWGVFVKGQTV